MQLVSWPLWSSSSVTVLLLLVYASETCIRNCFDEEDVFQKVWDSKIHRKEWFWAMTFENESIQQGLEDSLVGNHKMPCSIKDQDKKIYLGECTHRIDSEPWRRGTGEKSWKKRVLRQFGRNRNNFNEKSVVNQLFLKQRLYTWRCMAENR